VEIRKIDGLVFEMDEKITMNMTNPFKDKDVRQVKPLVLAFIGDGVYEMYVRNHVVTSSTVNVNEIHKRTVKFVKAVSQAIAVKEMMSSGFITEDEERVVKRARNQFNQTIPKSASVVEYKLATGFEALVGYLYYTGNAERLEEVVHYAIEVIERYNA
jgi:ribonuclease III family protein